MVYWIAAAAAVLCAVPVIAYYRSSYRIITRNLFLTTMLDKGRRGEYAIYRCLRSWERQGCRFLFNLYLPAAGGKTTEIDVILICPEGVFVFESKNYGGRIYGDESQKYWSQVFRGRRLRSRTERFFNPVWQNRTHSNALRRFLPPDAEVYSVVLFSNRCVFRRMNVSTGNAAVAHRRDARRIVKDTLYPGQPQPVDVDQVLETLFPYSQVSASVRRAHAAGVRKRQAARRSGRKK